jgi:hypothetical protein
MAAAANLQFGSAAFELEAIAKIGSANFSEALCGVAHVFSVEGLP